jgi:arsenite methyltransferase
LCLLRQQRAIVQPRLRSVYVADKRAAFREFARVLRPGGRISLFEPINRFAQRTADTWAGYDVAPLGEVGKKLRAVFEAIQPPDSDPMLDFDERDLIAFSEEAGFFPLRLVLEVDVSRPNPIPVVAVTAACKTRSRLFARSLPSS